MENYTIHNMKEVKRTIRKYKFKKKVKEITNDICGFIDDNRELIIVVGPVLLGAITTGINVVGKHLNLRKQEKIKDLYVYDRSLGHYWLLRRELTNKEWVEVDKRKANGERLADILSEMKVLK